MANTIRIPVPDVAYARVSLPEIDINDNPYEVLESAAVGIAGALAEREAQDDDAYLNEAEADWFGAAANHRLSAHRDGAAGHDQMLGLNDVLEERYKYWEAKTNKPALRRRLRQRFARMRFNALPADMRDEADARAQSAAETATQTMRRLAEVVFYRPEEIGAVREEARILRERHPEYEAQLAREEQLIDEAYLRGLIATNPKLALETLRSRKGYAEQDLGISEPLREFLEHEAERATEAETESHAAALEQERIGANLGVAALLGTARFDTGIPHEVYGRLRDAYKIDPKDGARLEQQVDEAHATTIRRAERHNNVGRALAGGRIVKWNAERLESLDTLIDAVATDGNGEATANDRRIRIAMMAGRTPPKMQGHILKSLRASDPTTRAGGLRLLQKLEEADTDGGLTAWLPPDQRAFAHRFAALGAAGYADAEALKHLDAAKSLTPVVEEARRHYFDTYVRMDDLIDITRRAYNIEPEGIADDERQTLEYRSDDDATRSQTLEYRPDRDGAPLQRVVERDRKGRVRFDELDPTSDDYDRGERVDTATGKKYPYVVGTIYTDSPGRKEKRRVLAKKDLSGDPRLGANCHGYTLAGGEVWIEPRDAEIILEEDYYRAPDLQPGDVVVYRDKQGVAVHSARVISVTPDGRGGLKVRVIGKRGQHDAVPIETDIDKQWPGRDIQDWPAYRGKRYRRIAYRKR